MFATPGRTVPPTSSRSHYRDPVFAVIWIAQWMVVVACAILYNPLQLQNQNDHQNDHPENWHVLLAILSMPLAVALGVCLVGWTILARYSHQIVPVAVVCGPVLAAVVAAAAVTYTTGAWQPAVGTGGGAIVLSALAYWWSRSYLACAAVTLQTALTAVRDGWLVMLAMGQAVLTYVWFVVWSLAAWGLYQQYYYNNENYNYSARMHPCAHDPRETCTDYVPYAVSSAMLVSLFWTCQVMSNVLHTTTAGTIGTWWTTSTNTNTNTNASMAALRRSLTTSLGSICFGSLVVAMVQTVEGVLSMANVQRNEKKKRDQRKRSSNDSAGSNALLERLLQWLRQLTQYLNAWAFCYVALYGDTYTAAGRKVAARLFSSQGLATLVSDRLVYRVLSMAQWSMAVATGAVTVLLQAVLSLGGHHYHPFDSSTTTEQTWQQPLVVFGVGSLVGYWMAGISLTVVESAVRTVLVCSAEDVGALHRHHPDLYRALQASWSQAYPAAWAAMTKKHA